MPFDRAFRAKWEAAGYEPTCGSAAVALPPPKQYLRVYHLASTDHAISNIALGRLKVARFSDLNDPFELLAANFRERPVRKVVRDFKSTYDSHSGLLCFSADWLSPVLWSHYAQKHRGICLGFNVKRTRLERVRYRDKRLLLELGEEGHPLQLGEKLQKLLLCTKFRHWRYEQEHRIFIKLEDTEAEGQLHFCAMGDDLELAEVILGPQCDLPLAEVRKLTASKHPKAITYQSRLAFKFFSVVPKESTVP